MPLFVPPFLPVRVEAEDDGERHDDSQHYKRPVRFPGVGSVCRVAVDGPHRASGNAQEDPRDAQDIPDAFLRRGGVLDRGRFRDGEGFNRSEPGVQQPGCPGTLETGFVRHFQVHRR
ncbi:hypothetical protein D9M72_574380 [compost metagenome]